MLRKLAYCLVLLSLLWCTTSYSQEQKSDEQLLSDYVDWFHSCEGKCQMNPKYTEKAKELIPYLIKHSRAYGIDPLLAAYTTSKESSWRNFKGSKGEVGPMHVMPGGKWAKKFDLTTLDGQIEAGCAHLRISMDKCKVGSMSLSLERMFTHYASGKCYSRSPTTQALVIKRLRKYLKALRRFR